MIPPLRRALSLISMPSLPVTVVPAYFMLRRINPFRAVSARKAADERDNGPPAQFSTSPELSTPASSLGSVEWVRHDPLLLSLYGLAALLVAYQLAVTLLKPPWLAPGTDWMRLFHAWAEFVPAVLLSVWLTRTNRAGKAAWCLFTLGMLSYAVAQTSWAMLNQVIYPGNVPFPYWVDLFYLLQYPGFFLALVLLPSIKQRSMPGLSRVKIILDSFLLTAAGWALCWYFLLAPIYLHSTQPTIGQLVNLAYPLGDLLLVVALSIVLIRWRRYLTERLTLHFLVVAAVLLMLGDSWYAYLNLLGIYYSGGPPDVLWTASYLAFGLAALTQLRAAQRGVGQSRPVAFPAARSAGEMDERVRYFAPFVAAFLASIAIVTKALMEPGTRASLIVPLGVSLGLLTLVMARQGITSLENAQLLREREAAHANDLALREAARKMDEFLGIASHELKTPLTTIMLGLQMAQRRLLQLDTPPEAEVDRKRTQVKACQSVLAHTFLSGQRLSRLVNDLLDTSRIQEGQLVLRRQQMELISLVQEAVEEERQAAPERTISLRLPEPCCVSVFADPDRIKQVITNYLTNALKYSPPGSPVVVGAQVEDQHVRVWVRDQGPGIAREELERIWKRFHRIPGIETQHDSGVGLGLGLHISKVIIEQHQGRVGVQSAPGMGSTFWFSIPLDTPGDQRNPSAQRSYLLDNH